MDIPKKIVYTLAVVSLTLMWLGVVGIAVILQLMFGEDQFLLRCTLLFPFMIVAICVTREAPALIRKILDF
jgi:hypothetical protein